MADLHQVQSQHAQQRPHQRQHQVPRQPGPGVEPDHRRHQHQAERHQRQRPQPQASQHHQQAQHQHRQQTCAFGVGRLLRHALVEHAAEHVGVQLHARHGHAQWRGHIVGQARGRGAQKHDAVAQQLGGRTVTQHIGGRDIGKAAFAAAKRHQGGQAFVDRRQQAPDLECFNFGALPGVVGSDAAHRVGLRQHGRGRQRK